MKERMQGTSSTWIALVVVLIVVVGAFVWPKSTNKSTPVQMPTGAYTSVADLDQASAELDATDVDGLGNELPQLQTDSSAF